jgi:hypothetical protein
MIVFPESTHVEHLRWDIENLIELPQFVSAIARDNCVGARA